MTTGTAAVFVQLRVTDSSNETSVCLLVTVETSAGGGVFVFMFVDGGDNDVKRMRNTGGKWTHAHSPELSVLSYHSLQPLLLLGAHAAPLWTDRRHTNKQEKRFSDFKNILYINIYKIIYIYLNYKRIYLIFCHCYSVTKCMNYII